jgi:hypothetical protein
MPTTAAPGPVGVHLRPTVGGRRVAVDEDAADLAPRFGWPAKKKAGFPLSRE